MGQVQHAHHAEDQGEAGGDQEQEHPVGQAMEDLNDDGGPNGIHKLLPFRKVLAVRLKQLTQGRDGWEIFVLSDHGERLGSP